MKKGTILQAEVVDVRDNGLYLQSGGRSGFMDVTQLTWKQNGAQPADFASIGDTITVVVTGVSETGFYASLKALDPKGDPFRDLSMYRPGVRHRGHVRAHAPYGVFVLLEGGAAGLLPGVAVGGRELPPLAVGEAVEVEIVFFDAAIHRIELRLV